VFYIQVIVDPETRAQIGEIVNLLRAANTKGDSIMSVITDWAAKEQADLTTISTNLVTITAGVKKLDDLITTFQQSPGTLTAADQAALDAIQAQSKTVLAASAAIDTSAPGSAPPA
jgi:hypothetical protein